MHEHAAVKKNIYTRKYHIKQTIQNIGNCIFYCYRQCKLIRFGDLTFDFLCLKLPGRPPLIRMFE